MKLVDENQQIETAYDNIPEIGETVKIIECGTSEASHVGRIGKVVGVNEENHDFYVELHMPELNIKQECLAVVVEPVTVN